MKVSLFTLAATAALISSATATVTIDWVTVGNPGNAADTTGYGAVGYEYQIGKYEVTNAQYSEFLNAKASTDHYLANFAPWHTDTYSLYNPNNFAITRSGSSGSYTYSVTAGWANRPVTHVSWYDAARFCNWISNGQGNGDTETGSYALNGASDGIITVNGAAKVYIPNEDEWYKAAYYNGTTGTYSLYANGQDTITAADANIFSGLNWQLTDVGSYSSNQNGTFDQNGNVSEWNDAIISQYDELPNGVIFQSDELLFFEFYRGIRGGNCMDFSLTQRDYHHPFSEQDYHGFRVASIAAIPEPGTAFLGALSLIGLLRRKR